MIVRLPPPRIPGMAERHPRKTRSWRRMSTGVVCASTTVPFGNEATYFIVSTWPTSAIAPLPRKTSKYQAPDRSFVNSLRSMPSEGAKATESIGSAGVGAVCGAEPPPQAISAAQSAAPVMFTVRRAARDISGARGFDRRVQILAQGLVATDDGIPGDLRSVPAALGNHLDALRRDRHGEDLSLVFQLSLDALVEL